MFPIMSYADYLKATNQKDSRNRWVWWKVEICGMEYAEAVRASIEVYAQ